MRAKTEKPENVRTPRGAIVDGSLDEHIVKGIPPDDGNGDQHKSRKDSFPQIVGRFHDFLPRG